ncbi:MAG: hypothetical protein ACYSU0_08695 [Planctomycetota bacterium]|jgi:hypothetical protein
MANLRVGFVETTHEDEPGHHLRQVSYGLTLKDSRRVWVLAWAGHWDGHGSWGTGPAIGLGFGMVRRRAEAYVLPAAYTWVGEYAGDIDVGIEGRASLCVALRF